MSRSCALTTSLQGARSARTSRSLATREWRFVRELLAPRTLAAFLVVAAPWYVAILRDQGRHFLEVFDPNTPFTLTFGLRL